MQAIWTNGACTVIAEEHCIPCQKRQVQPVTIATLSTVQRPCQPTPVPSLPPDSYRSRGKTVWLCGWADTLVIDVERRDAVLILIWNMPLGRKHWIGRNLFIETTTKTCQSALAETCLDNSAWNTEPQKMEEGGFSRISELGGAAAPFKLMCQRQVLSLQKRSCNTGFLIHSRNPTERNAGRIVAVRCCLCFRRPVLVASGSTTFEKPGNGSYLYDPMRPLQMEGERQGSVSVDCGISAH